MDPLLVAAKNGGVTAQTLADLDAQDADGGGRKTRRKLQLVRRIDGKTEVKR